ncbi:MAG: hypothetical protein KF863_02170 [Rubrivivax sp.]|nr:hypothetical protein [Rubrivivax sp.]
MKRTLLRGVLALGLLVPCAVLAQLKTYQLANPLPFPVQVRILGEGPQFPQVVMLPAPPAPPVPVPYPGLSMQLQVKQPNGQWSPALRLPWRSGKITLPTL